MMTIMALPLQRTVHIAAAHRCTIALAAPESRRLLHIFNIKFIRLLCFIIAVI